MNMDVAAIFLASSILVMLGLIVWIIAILIVNNLMYKYWKSFNLYRIVDPDGRFEVKNKDGK
jgi:hypothetical protein